MKAETITGAMGTLEEAGIPEEQRMATVKAIAQMQQPLFDAIGNLESKMDARLEKMETRFKTMESSVTDLRVEMARRDARLAKRDTWLIVTGITLALSTVGMLVRLLTLSML